MLAPYAALLVRVHILPLVTLQQHSSLLSPFSNLLNTSTTTRLFYKHLEFRESQTSLLAVFSFDQRSHLRVEFARSLTL
ncbi:hypothetical protein HDV62DRAFT_366711 [Trichoderma sp. SZMC 28011]